MAVEIQIKSDGHQRVMEFPDGPDITFTAQQFADGRVEVTQHRRGSSGGDTIIHTVPGDEVERVINNGWPNDNGPLD